MGWFDKLFGKNTQGPLPEITYQVDLVKFRCNNSILGQAPSTSDEFQAWFEHSEVFDDTERNGVEIGVEDHRLDYVSINLEKFQGDFLGDGRPLALENGTSEDVISSLFGEPYFREVDDDEVLLFYSDGRVEIQFEIPHSSGLNQIVMLLNPILADPEARQSRGVTKTWPPQGSIRVQQ